MGRVYSNYKLTTGALCLLLAPVFILWLFICGGQYYVGTDYPSYLQIFEGTNIEFYLQKHEYLFVAIVMFCNKCGLHGQTLFYIFYTINFIFFFLIVKRLPLRNIFIFVLLYITVTNLFNNQLNTLRQATAIYIGTYAILSIIEGKNIKATFFILIASLIHISALILFLVFIFKQIISSFSFKSLLLSLFAAVGLSFVFQPDILNFILLLLPDHYAAYLENGAIAEQGLIYKIAKYIFIPIYLLAWGCFKDKELSKEATLLFKLGWIAFCLRLGLINLTIITRITDYFLIMSIYPILLYLSYLIKTKHSFLFISITFFLSLFYCLKVTLFASKEYLYNSIYL